MKKINYFKLIFSLLICQMAGIVGSFFTVSQIPNWYSTLLKPAWTPASWVFGPVWITLYFLMGISLYLIWQKRGEVNIKKAIWIFSLQLFFNAIWSIIFFGYQNILGGLVNIIVLLLFIVWTMIEFNKINKWAMYLLVPYISWVCLATALNYTIWILN